ncbi:MAG: conjugative transposon protein TraM [Candidatus Pedobacter colombiensis]|uniref:Conjugative transposon protein TraM n=1 Tax=Candidatus Pedobacter colombiensis TaxID=3121371 RepID=A0AAJ5W893_9SPHI|nr:conjugative transposon protein TraM [Pedobacter sp.]WEK20438.1 MAG: conjugative transposon protein TraM [Pedobacter sp.]
METTLKDKRKNRFLLVLPLLVFFPLLAYVVFFGAKDKFSSEKEEVPQGINASLPDAKLAKVDPVTKLGFYELAGKDTAKFRSSLVENRIDLSSRGVDPQAERINERLAALNQELAKPASSPAIKDRYTQVQSVNMKSDVDRLEMLMKSMQGQKEQDPEMQQLGGMLQQIIDIQHPELVKERVAQSGSRVINSDSLFRAVPAVIVTKKRIVHGASIELSLLDSVWLKGQLIPKGHRVFGVCRVTNQRVLIDIKNIRLGNSIVPTSLSVYSLDGMEGLNAPEAMLTDALNGGTIDASSSIGLGSFDQSLVTQVAGAGIDAAKGLLSKKLRRVKVSLKAGEKVLLRNNQIQSR